MSSLAGCALNHCPQDAVKWHKSRYASLVAMPRSCPKSCYATSSSSTTFVPKNATGFPLQILSLCSFSNYASHVLRLAKFATKVHQCHQMMTGCVRELKNHKTQHRLLHKTTEKLKELYASLNSTAKIYHKKYKSYRAYKFHETP